MSPRPHNETVARRARFEVALTDLCRAARTQGLEARELAAALLSVGAHYARISSWSLTFARRRFGALWREEEESARTAEVLNEPRRAGGVCP